jgi:hypothetical protein
VQSAREAARRTQSLSNLRQIGIALHCYHDARRALPPGFRSTTTGTWAAAPTTPCLNPAPAGACSHFSCRFSRRTPCIT